jgi:SAM-dependent methyltransferase
MRVTKSRLRARRSGRRRTEARAWYAAPLGMDLDAREDGARAPARHDGHAPSRAYAWAIFLGAFLAFEVQLVLAKALLPWFGGAPAVWTTCMLFFQALLLAGYAWAHAAVRFLGPRAQGGLQLGLIALAVAVLPIVPTAPEHDPSAAPVAAILALLGSTVALPCLVLSSSSPLLSAWFARAGGGARPYRLYALSNAGSMLALLAYPLLVEPLLSLRQQQYAWSAAFAVFALLSAWCVRDAWRAPSVAVVPDAQAETPSPSARERFLWLVLPMCAVVLLLAVTNHLCQEVAVVPLLWVVPLALYLFSFALTFESERWYRRSWCLPVLILTLFLLGQATSLGGHVGIRYAVPVYSLGLFVLCLFCHGELAARRPAARHLTAYYLWIALGGALGGVFVSLLAPRLFRGFDELYVGLLLCAALATGFAFRDPAYRRARGRWNPSLLALIVATGVIGMLLGGRLSLRSRPGRQELRDFYGTLKIEDRPASDGSGSVRFLAHGNTRHGQQFLAPERRAEPTTYYGPASGIGLLLREMQGEAPMRVGLIGLGAGTLASYGRAGDAYCFYELSPLVIEVARREFTFLADSAAAIEVVPGDARLALQREEPRGYDVLVVDAFSSDAIPVHLLTREAFELYARHLAPRGVLALHVTTRHLDLGPLIQSLAQATGQLAFEVLSAADEDRGQLDARWILVAAERSRLERPRLLAAGRLLEGADLPRPWTDDHSNLLQVINK